MADKDITGTDVNGHTTSSHANGTSGLNGTNGLNSTNGTNATHGTSTNNITGKTFFSIGDKDEFSPEKWTTLLPQRQPETGIRVLIIGAGYAGLTAALECWRQGHTVVGILERSAGPNYSGDLIIIQPSALEMMRHWPQMRSDLARDRVDAGTYYYRFDGELLDGPSYPNFNDPAFVAERKVRHGDVPGGFAESGAVQIRKTFFRMLLRQVACLGLRVEYGQRVEQYVDDEVSPGVVLSDGSKRHADLIIAADGLRSRSEKSTLGNHSSDGMQPSGMSVYRTAFPVERAFAGSEMVRKRWQGRHTYEFWMGSGMHIGLYMSDKIAALGITPRDEFLLDKSSFANESWDPQVSPDEVIAVMRRAMGHESSDNKWHPVLEELVRTAPEGSLIHWPLYWRNLHHSWTSPSGRIVQIGDAAHSTVPASAAGGTLALEDAVTLAACLGKAGSRENIALATRVYNLLRYQRASCTQKVAFVNAQTLGHTTDWDALRKDPTKARLRYPKWLFRHDPEGYVDEKWTSAVAHIVNGVDFANTNIPPGHHFTHWTIEDIHRQIAEGKRVEDLLDGDWS